MARRVRVVVETLPAPKKTSVYIPEAVRRCKMHRAEAPGVAHFARPGLHFPPSPGGPENATNGGEYHYPMLVDPVSSFRRDTEHREPTPQKV